MKEETNPNSQVFSDKHYTNKNYLRKGQTYFNPLL